MTFTAREPWVLPEGTVLVKTFSLERETGNPLSRRRVETRLLVLYQGEWQGYSYAWDDAQTDAVLVAAAGNDRVFSLAKAGAASGARKQTWHYPSRAECMVCHSRAAGFVLGVCTNQMNRLHDYGATRENQLTALLRRVFAGQGTRTPADFRGALRGTGHDGPRLPAPFCRPAGAIDLPRRLRSFAQARWAAVQKDLVKKLENPTVLSGLLPQSVESYPCLPDPYAPAATLQPGPARTCTPTVHIVMSPVAGATLPSI